MVREHLASLAAGEHLTRLEAAALMRSLMSGDTSPALIGAVLTALRIKGERAEELSGFAEAMREHAIRITPRCERLVDTCGTGGGGIPTFNISTTAAFVVAGAGVSVAKHGNRAMTSRCGSADVLEALGIPVNLPPERICAAVEEVGIGFMFAQAHHPAMRHVGPVRQQLPFRTVFNALGPLANPAGAGAQVVGVYELRLVSLLAETLAALGCEHALVVHGLDGLDELSTLGPTRVGEVRNGDVTYREMTPEELGLVRVRPEVLAPGADAAANAAITRAVLAGEFGPRREIVLLNAAAAIMVAGKATDLSDGLRLAAESIDTGAATARLEALISFASE